jgi:REP element-mobilizing transposase RayT
VDFISPNSPAYYLTSVAKDRLPVFRREAFLEKACAAMDEARKSAGFLILAYVIMPDHLHVITDNARKPAEIQRHINGIMARRIIDHLKAQGPGNRWLSYAGVKVSAIVRIRCGIIIRMHDCSPAKACLCSVYITRIKTQFVLAWSKEQKTIGFRVLAYGTSSH